MGGRGTFASGNSVPFTYRTVGEIAGIKILEGIGNLHDLPMESHSSPLYAKTDKHGNIAVIRFYGADHRVRLEIASHPERELAQKSKTPRNKPILHYHTYSYRGGTMARSKANFLTPAMRKRYGSLFGRNVR